MTLRKKTPTILVKASELKLGQYIIANSGDIREVTPTIKRSLPRNVHVRTFAA